MPIDTRPPGYGRVLATLLLALTLGGCGYQLKGQFQVADELSPMVWSSQVDAEQLYLEARRTFALFGVVLATRPADTRLQVHRVDDSELFFNGFTVLVLEVEWSLVNAYGVTVLDHVTTRAETRLELSPEIGPEEAITVENKYDLEQARDEDIYEAWLERRSFLRNRVALRMLDRLEAVTSEELNRMPADSQ